MHRCFDKDDYDRWHDDKEALKDYEKYKEFVLGEGQGTKCSFRKTRAISTVEYYNGPLQPGTEYKTFARGYTSEVY